jgi:hypothetical protein
MADHHKPAHTSVENRQQRCAPERRAPGQGRDGCPFALHGIGLDHIEMDGYPGPAAE